MTHGSKQQLAPVGANGSVGREITKQGLACYSKFLICLKDNLAPLNTLGVCTLIVGFLGET